MTKRPKIGLGILILNINDEILLGKRKASHGEATWGPPGGHLEFGESFEQCAIREVLEETALNIIEPQFLAMTNDFFVEEDKHYVSIFMTAKYPRDQQLRNCEPHKVEQWQWFSLNNLPTDLFLPLKHLVAKQGYGKELHSF